jgi:hypothetical protein
MNGESKEKGMRATKITFGVVVVLVVIVIVLYPPDLVSFSDSNIADYMNLLAPLVLISLFIERALEVFLTVWRGPGSSKKELALKQSKSQPNMQLDSVHDKEDDLLDHKNHTQRLAFMASVILGVIISAMGIRALELFVDADAFAELHDFQRVLFQIVDVLITGALLGGGADGIHKIVSAFTTFMDKTKTKAEN